MATSEREPISDLRVLNGGYGRPWFVLYDPPKRQRTTQAGCSDGCQRSELDPNAQALGLAP